MIDVHEAARTIQERREALGEQAEQEDDWIFDFIKMNGLPDDEAGCLMEESRRIAFQFFGMSEGRADVLLGCIGSAFAYGFLTGKLWQAEREEAEVKP